MPSLLQSTNHCSSSSRKNSLRSFLPGGKSNASVGERLAQPLGIKVAPLGDGFDEAHHVLARDVGAGVGRVVVDERDLPRAGALAAARRAGRTASEQPRGAAEDDATALVQEH